MRPMDSVTPLFCTGAGAARALPRRTKVEMMENFIFSVEEDLWKEFKKVMLEELVCVVILVE